MSSPAPAWRLSSVQWLRQNYASLDHVGRGMSAPDALMILLRKIGYSGEEFKRAKESSGFSKSITYDDWLRELVQTWSEADHKKMMAWQRQRSTGKKTVLDALDDKIKGKEITGAWVDEAELIKGDHPDMEPIAVVENGKKSRKPSRKSAEKLEAVDDLEDAVVYGSPAAGSW